MKKHNFFAGTAFAVPVFTLIMMTAGCTSVPKLPPADPLSVLGTDSSVYFKIPVQTHKDFVKSVIVSQIPQLSEKDADQIIGHLDMIYAGLGNKNDLSGIDISASGTIPSIAVKTALTEKNGWGKNTVQIVSDQPSVRQRPYSYYTRSDTAYQLAVPSPDNVLLSKNVVPLIRQYDKSLQENVNAPDAAVPDIWVSDTYTWMTAPSADIRFCVLRPQAFLAKLLGIDMRLALACAKGSLAETADSDNMDLELELEFQNVHAVRAAQIMMQMALGNGIIMESPENSQILKVRGVRISKVQVLDLLVQ